jgi:hypothetical protein
MTDDKLKNMFEQAFDDSGVTGCWDLATELKDPRITERFCGPCDTYVPYFDNQCMCCGQ